MSFYFGTILEKQILLLGDRMYYNGLDEPMTGLSKVDKINNSIFSVWGGGSLFAGNEILKIIRDLCYEPIKSWELEGKRGRDISKLALSFWKEKVLKDPRATSEFKDKGRLFSLNILLGGLDSEDHPFLANLFDEGNFEIQFYKRPGISVISPNTPEIIEWVRKKIREFLTVAMPESEKKQKELGKEMLPGVLKKVSQEDKFVSSSGNMIFVDRKGVDLFNFGLGRVEGVIQKIGDFGLSVAIRSEKRKRLAKERLELSKERFREKFREIRESLR